MARTLLCVLCVDGYNRQDQQTTDTTTTYIQTGMMFYTQLLEQSSQLASHTHQLRTTTTNSGSHKHLPQCEYVPPTARDILHRSHLLNMSPSPDCFSFACGYSYGSGHQVEIICWLPAPRRIPVGLPFSRVIICVFGILYFVNMGGIHVFILASSYPVPGICYIIIFSYTGGRVKQRQT